MKLLAGRGRRDGDDIEQLLGICGFNSIEAVEEIFDRYYPQDVIAPRARRRTEAWLAEH